MQLQHVSRGRLNSELESYCRLYNVVDTGSRASASLSYHRIYGLAFKCNTFFYVHFYIDNHSVSEVIESTIS